MADTENRALNDKFMLRLPEGMRERIRAEAEANNRSMNSEIVARLEASLSGKIETEAKCANYLEHLLRQQIAGQRPELVEDGATITLQITMTKSDLDVSTRA